MSIQSIVYLTGWLKPRSRDRDEAFRERTIRLIILIIVSLTGLTLISSLFVFRDPIEPISYPTLYIIVILLSVLAGIAISQQKPIIAGTLLVVALLNTPIWFHLISEESYASQINVTHFLLTLILTYSVLPKRAIWWVAGISILLVNAIELDQPGLNEGESQVGSIIIVTNTAFLLGSALFLYHRAAESDARLNALGEANSQLEVAKADAERANHAKSNFLASMSHEFRTPLNAIVGYVDILRHGMAGNLTDKQSEILYDTALNTQRLLTLINDLLDVAKIESGRIVVSDTDADPRVLVDTVINSMQSLAVQKQVELKAIYTSETPALVFCDVHKFQQILTNLVSNAIKFTKQGGVYITVDAPDSASWRVSVRDTGVGMPAGSEQHIFEKFQQVAANQHHQDQKGTGLGLAIVKGFVELMAGSIFVETKEGQGSTFTIMLPRDRRKIVTLTEGSGGK